MTFRIIYENVLAGVGVILLLLLAVVRHGTNS